MRRTAANLFLLVVSTTVVLVSCEVAVRWTAPTWLAFRMETLEEGTRQDEASLGTDRSWPIERRNGDFYRFTPSSTFPVLHAEYHHDVHTDDLGGRVTPDSPSGKKLPFLGDSFAFGLGVEDDEAFISLLDASLHADLENLGVPGSTLSHHLDMIGMRHEELGRPATYLFAVFLGNDLVDLLRAERATETSYVAGSSGGLLWQMNAWAHEVGLLRDSYLVQFAKQRMLAWRNARSADAVDPIFLVSERDGPALEEGALVLDRTLTRLDTLSARLGFESAFLLIPDRVQVSTRRRGMMVEYYGLDEANLDVLAVNDVYTSALREHGYPVFDASACMANASDPDHLYFVSDNHLTAAGHRRLADCSSAFVASATDQGKMPISR